MSLQDEAQQILRGNDRGAYTVPTHGLYPYQWNWDSAFAAWGFATFDLPRAWVEVETLFSGQWESGMVPHILFHEPDEGYFPGPDVWGCNGKGPIASSGISQPPVAASFIRAIWEADKAYGDERLLALMPKIEAWHRWFMKWRCEGGAIFITHPWEAGRDNAPDWDSAMGAVDPTGVGAYTRRDTSHVDADMRPTKNDYDRYIWLVQRGRALGWEDGVMAEARPFAVADPTMTFILLRACRDWVVMAEALGLETGPTRGWIADLERGAARLWDGENGFFCGIDLATGQHTGHLSSASYLCWYAGIDEPRMLHVLHNALRSCDYPLPSHDVKAAEFDGMRYWRGPTWPILNYLIGRGLADCGHNEEAERLRHATKALIRDHGFSEYFDPVSGVPAGGKAFTWTAAVWLGWAGQE